MKVEMSIPVSMGYIHISARSPGLHVISIKGQTCRRRYQTLVPALSKDQRGVTLLRV
jgi:hypothetical protein